ncbi:MAG: type I-MYXAN CRISPR-associated protein Cas6/Cmx6 [Gammaproteobacteria bacterium]
MPDNIVDVLYAIECRCLPLDHAHALSQALLNALPWLPNEPQAGIHLIHVAESGNGWYRPEDPDNEVLVVSRRTRMALRLPKKRLEDAKALIGLTLDVDGFSMRVGAVKTRPLSALSTMFARYVQTTGLEQEEQEFLEQVAAGLTEKGIETQKMLCGRINKTRTPNGPIYSRSIMLADLAPKSAIRLQEQGLGPGRKMGFGLFLPHKSIRAVTDTNS